MALKNRDFLIRAQRRVFIGKLRVNTGNQYQKTDQSHSIQMCFFRHEPDLNEDEWFKDSMEEDDGWISREEMEKDRKVRKRGAKRDKK